MRVPGLLFEIMEIYPDMRDINQFTVVQGLRPVQLSPAEVWELFCVFCHGPVAVGRQWGASAHCLL